MHKDQKGNTRKTAKGHPVWLLQFWTSKQLIFLRFLYNNYGSSNEFHHFYFQQRNQMIAAFKEKILNSNLIREHMHSLYGKALYGKILLHDN